MGHRLASHLPITFNKVHRKEVARAQVADGGGRRRRTSLNVGALPLGIRLGLSAAAARDGRRDMLGAAGAGGPRGVAAALGEAASDVLETL